MSTKTDLAKEIIDKISSDYTKKRFFSVGGTEISEFRIETDEESALFGKSKGTYITAEADSIRFPAENFEREVFAASAQFRKMIPEKGDILAVGLGNPKLTADSLGTECIDFLFCGDFFGRKLFSICPGVEGKTSIKPEILVEAAAEKLHPAAVVVFDSLAAEDFSTLFRTVQLTDSGIAPGSGIGKSKGEISKSTLGIPVIGAGTPTVIRYPDPDFAFVSPGDSDILIKRAARLLAFAFETAVFPEFDIEFLKELHS